MFLLIADEAVHQQTDPTKYFIYGAIIVPSDKLQEITEGIDQIRIQYGFKPDDSLKFSPNDRPRDVNRNEFIKAKDEILVLSRKLGIKFIGYAVLHAIARTKSSEQLITMGADALLTKFQQFLEESEDSRGICLFDTLPIPHPNHYLRRAFQMRKEHSVVGHRLHNIDLIATTTDGCSHLPSICDVCVGSFRYSVNEPERDVVGKQLMRHLKGLFWVSQRDGKVFPLERGLLLRPQQVTHPPYLADYTELKTRLFSWMNSSPQG